MNTRKITTRKTSHAKSLRSDITPVESVEVETMTLDQMMPMNLIIDNNAVIIHAGPTIEKILGKDPTGLVAFSLFEPRRPRIVSSVEDVRALGGSKIHLRIRDSFQISMVGSVAVLPCGDKILMNLSFGYRVVEAVARYQLAGSDFAPTDLTLEMLYLMEAKSAAIEATADLAGRLNNEKAIAQVEAMTDGLTRLNNRRACDVAFKRARHRGKPFALMQLDLDYFKSVNDSLGHAAGDVVLRTVANILTEETRERDVVARVGGDEFVIIFYSITDISGLERIASRLIEKLEQPIPFESHECQISASIGIVVSSDYKETEMGKMNVDVDNALYASKRKGRACFTVFRPELAVDTTKAAK